nr:outer membrane beta-barrel protein [uncultured Mucilaginibacter sp.]
MRVTKGCLLLAMVAGFYSFCCAQTVSSVLRGNIYIQNNAAAEAATAILLRQADSSIVMSALVDGKGGYEFLNVQPGSYLVLAYRLGYVKAHSATVRVAAGQSVTIQNIYLQPLSTELKEVAVVAKKPFVEVRPGKTIINPSASITADGKNVLDILAQSPGVKVSNTDDITISGRQNALVLIDGKTTSMTGADLAALLRATQGSNVERIELITAGSAKYDASAGGVINIILKKGKNIGTNGTVTLTAGYGKYYKGVAGFTFNSRGKYVNIFGLYNINANKTYRGFTSNRKINDNGLISNYDLTYYGEQKTINHNYRLGADFSLSANHTLGVQIYGFRTDNDFAKNNSLKISNQGHLDSVVQVGSTVERDLYNINYNINYAGKLDDAGKAVSASVTYLPYNRRSNEYINNMFFDAAGAKYRPDNLLQNLSPSHRRNWTGLLDYTNPLSKTSKLEAGFKFSHTQSDNNLIFGPQVNGVYTVDPIFSNNFVYNEDVQAGYLNYTATFGKFDMVAGLRGEYTHSRGQSVNVTSTSATLNIFNYFKLFPNLLLHYVKDDKNEYSLTFARGILRPDYESLNPFLYYVDPYDFQSGNPYLKPEYTNTITLTYLYNQSISFGLYAGKTTDANFAFYTQNDATKVNLTTTRNLGDVKDIGLQINAPYAFTGWWSGELDVNAGYYHYTTYPENGGLDKGTGDVIINSTQNFALGKSLALEVTGFYETANQYGIRRFSPNYYVNAGLSTPVLGKRGKLSLNVADIFNTNRDRAYTRYQNIDLRIGGKPETRIARLSFSYRFGKTTVKAATKHVTGTEQEQDRMRKSAN